MRGRPDFEDLGSYRAFVDETIGEAERAHLQVLPERRTTDFEEVIVTVSGKGGFTLRKVYYTVLSHLIGHRLRVRLFNDRLEVFMGGTHLLSLPRGRAVCRQRIIRIAAL